MADEADFYGASEFAARIFAVPEGSVVRASGSIPVRLSDGRIEVGLIHRPAYDDWSFPKGKLEKGEDFARAALRESREEIGFEIKLGRPLGCTAYIDPRGRPKIACYYLGQVEQQAFRPTAEVDRLEWLPRAVAVVRLSSEGDRLLLRAAQL